MTNYCRDCKWFKQIALASRMMRKMRKCYICTNETRERHNKKKTEYDFRNPCQAACRTGFESKRR